MAVERLIGVDFGTSTSVIRVKRYENGKPVGEKLETKDVVFGGGYPMTPTLIAKKKDKASVCYIGHDARSKSAREYTQFREFKMDLESSDPVRRNQARQLTEEFYGFLAKQYKSQSEHLGEFQDQERTIISYPVKWSEETKTFMLETAKKAGFPNVTGMDEAQAAIQAVIVMSTDHLKKHGLLQDGAAANILLIDMGAGTTDLVLTRYTPGEKGRTEVLNTWPKGGDIQFGGREIDELLKNFFRNLLDEEDAEMVFRRVGSDKFKTWKEETVSPGMSRGDAVTSFEPLDNYIEDREMQMDAYCLDRNALEHCLADYLKQFPELVNGCLKDAGMDGGDVDLVIVTGGHSQWYFVNELLLGRMPQFGNPGLTKIRENAARIIPVSRPQETVALGLAYSGIPLDVFSGTVPPAQDKKQVVQELNGVIDKIKEQKQETTDVPDEDVLHIKLDLVNKSFSLSGKGTVVLGTVVQGSVKVGDTVSLCNKDGQIQVSTVKNLALSMEGKNITTARKGDYIAILLPGLSLYAANKGTYITNATETAAPVNVTPASADSGWQAAQQAAKRTAEQAARAAQEAAQRASQEAAQRAAQLAAEQKRQQEMEEARRRAAAMEIKPEDIPLTPESEFEIGSVGWKDCSIKKYIGNRAGVKIPSTIRGRKVVEIEMHAFGAVLVKDSNQTVEAVIIPDTVTTIASRAFVGCSKLRLVQAKNVRDIGLAAFSTCTSLEKAVFGDHVVNIGAEAFGGCGKLREVTFGKYVEKIGANAFLACRQLVKADFGMGECDPGHVIFPPKLKSIGIEAFHTNELLCPSRCIFKEIQMSRNTKVANFPGLPTFNPKYCAVFYYD